jgi:hypothetical protein
VYVIVQGKFVLFLKLLRFRSVQLFLVVFVF